jgi:large subunit ribosomal protein L32e
MTITQALKVRATIKRRKPHFIREESSKIKKLSKMGWRKPRGWHNKMRHGFKGHRRCVEVGWGSPKEVKGLHRSGMEMVIVYNPQQLEAINSEKQGIIIGSTVGAKKKIEIINAAMKNKIAILNYREPAKFIESTMQAFKLVKEAREKKKEQKKKKEAAPKKSIDQKVEKTSLTDEEKKKEDKKEMDKLLIKENK